MDNLIPILWCLAYFAIGVFFGTLADRENPSLVVMALWPIVVGIALIFMFVITIPHMLAEKICRWLDGH